MKKVVVGLVILMGMMATRVQAEEFGAGMLHGTVVTTIGVNVNASYASCRNSAAKVDLYVVSNGQPQIHNRCYLNSPADPVASAGVCPFRYPLAQGREAKDIFVRIWKISSDCSKYADELGAVTQYNDFVLSGTVGEDPGYDAANQARMVTIDKPSYRVKIDPYGGTTFEFYSKRATGGVLGQGNFTNSIHAHSGAALQVALHSEYPKSRTLDPCASQGYYNPTQAGAACQYKNGVKVQKSMAPDPANSPGLTISCDGVLNNSCRSATSTLEIGMHRMMNWDYGPGYEGPYNDGTVYSGIWPGDKDKPHHGDQLYLAQKTTATDNYLEYDFELKNNDPSPLKGALEFPTYYFNNQFGRFYYQTEGGSIGVEDIPINRRGLETESYYKSLGNDDRNWITFENVNFVNNDYLTLAWFYTPEVKNIIDTGWAGRGANISRTSVYHQIKLSNARMMTLQPQKKYGFKYVLFPYKYDEIIQSKYGSLSVLETINQMKLEISEPVLTPTIITTIVPTIILKPGDVNGDGVVNLVDFSLWKQEYSKKVTTKKADFNNDGIVNLVDFSIWKREYSRK